MKNHDTRSRRGISGRFRRHLCDATHGHRLSGDRACLIVLAFVWVIWVTLGTFRAWQDGQVGIFDVMWSALRASIVLMVLGFYLR